MSLKHQIGITTSKSLRINSYRKTLPWLVFGISSFFVFFQVLLQTSTSVMISDLEKAFSIDILGVSLLAASFFYTYLVLQIPAGILVDRFGARIVLLGSLILTAIACLIFSQTETLTLAVLSRILLGISCAPSIVAALYLMARWFPSHYFAVVVGLMEMLAMLGGAAGEVVIAMCVDYFGWRSTLLGCGLIAIFLTFLVWALVRDYPEPNNPLLVSDDKAGEKKGWKNLYYVLTLPQAWINGIYAGLIFGVLAAFAGFWCIPYLMHRYEISLTVAANASALMFIGAAVGAPLFGLWADRLGQRRLPMIMAASLLIIIMLVLFYFPGVTMEWVYVLLLSLGFCSGVYILPFVVMRDMTPIYMRATAMGYTNMLCILIGAPILQPLIGWIVRHDHGDYQQAFLVLPICVGIALILGFLVREDTIPG